MYWNIKKEVDKFKHKKSYVHVESERPWLAYTEVSSQSASFSFPGTISDSMF